MDILKVAREGARKTRIMYIANLSYRLLEKYLGETVQLGLLHSSDYRYEVTKKGRAFLEKYSDFSSRYSKVDNELQRMLLERESLERLCEQPRAARAKVVSQRRR